MSYRPLLEPGELWKTLTKKINDALDYLYGLAGEILGVEKSIEKDESTSKISLVNDLTDAEILAQGKELVYGATSTGERGWKEDTGGKVGTKEVDETNIADDKILVYNSLTGYLEYETKPTSSSTSAGFLLLPYLLYRTATGSTFTGYIDVQFQISASSDFATTITDLDSGTSQTNWKCFSTASGEYLAWDAAGMPATDTMAITYLGTLTLAKGYYGRWRVYEHGTSNYGDWIPLGVI